MRVFEIELEPFESGETRKVACVVVNDDGIDPLGIACVPNGKPLGKVVPGDIIGYDGLPMRVLQIAEKRYDEGNRRQGE